MRSSAAGMMAFGVVCLSAAAVCVGEEKNAAELFPTYKTGETARYVFEMERTNVMSFQFGAKESKEQEGKKPEATQTGTQKQELKEKVQLEMQVLEASESGTSIQLKVVAIEASSEDDITSKQLKYDSSNPADDGDRSNKLLQTLKPCVGASVTIQFDGKGNVVSMQSDATVAPNEMSSLPDAFLSPERSRIFWTSVFYPKNTSGAVNVGDKWNKTQTVDFATMGKVNCKLDFSFASLHGSNANIVLNGKYETLSQPTKDKAEKVSMTKSSLNGNLLFDTKAGHVTSGKFEEEIEIAANAQGINVKRSHVCKITISRQ